MLTSVSVGRGGVSPSAFVIGCVPPVADVRGRLRRGVEVTVYGVVLHAAHHPKVRRMRIVWEAGQG